MARWEPNARERLVRSAVELFAEQGYEATTVTEIAERAGGLTKTTFFRHFADKREVLFAGQEIHGRIVAEAIAEAPASATPLEMVGLALDGLASSFTEDRRDIGRKLRTVVAHSAELQERSAAKRAALSETMARALRTHGVSELVADLAADLGVRAFYRAFDQWASSADSRTLVEYVPAVFSELKTAVSVLE
ncbi:transcriptional regulator, TetR family [Catenulispora acidiphila DSM 44928]|uniref:Transcriptional regulator, TetR family n=1 Tax=Catenulispora acidiphila (strain DSM 44928 / JCM 14897 / NBRC 102108 / NRRL B-24433 / ID139908) TaxID=479433 RepID=C7QJX3_CATAD|nr:TetR/AcrR family transcriptional regulator [Catenulispora acidiphila]ACU73211.1 transcriptional regulator, TetR family [Catenulispora acidiphila DSM 44928]